MVCLNEQETLLLSRLRERVKRQPCRTISYITPEELPEYHPIRRDATATDQTTLVLTHGRGHTRGHPWGLDIRRGDIWWASGLVYMTMRTGRLSSGGIAREDTDGGYREFLPGRHDADCGWILAD